MIPPAGKWRPGGDPGLIPITTRTPYCNQNPRITTGRAILPPYPNQSPDITAGRTTGGVGGAACGVGVAARGRLWRWRGRLWPTFAPATMCNQPHTHTHIHARTHAHIPTFQLCSRMSRGGKPRGFPIKARSLTAAHGRGQTLIELIVVRYFGPSDSKICSARPLHGNVTTPQS